MLGGQNKIGLIVSGIIIVISLSITGFRFWKYYNVPPLIDFEYDQSVTVGQMVEFINTSAHVEEGGTWIWTFGDSSDPSSDYNTTHQYPTTGTFPVSLTYENGEEKLIKKAAIIVSTPFPEAIFEVKIDSVFRGEPVELKNLAKNAKTTLWQTSEGFFSAEKDPRIIFASTGKHSISMTAVNEIGQLDQFIVEFDVKNNRGRTSFTADAEVEIVRHIAVFDEQGLSQALTSLANNELSRKDKRRVRTNILRDVESLKIMINDLTLENYLNKIQLEASSRKVIITVTQIDRNSSNKIEGITIK